MGWYENYRQELSNKKPLFITIYAIIFLGIVLTSCYVFIAIYSGKPFDSSTTTTSTSTWFFSSSSSSASDITSTPIEHTANLSASTPESGVPVSPSLTQSTGTRPIWEVPPGTEMPPPETFQLTKALVESRVKDNTIIVTFGNYAFEDFILNWVRHLTDLGLSNLLVGAMDTKLLEALYWKGVPVFDMGSNMSVIDVGWGSATFHKMGREKVILIDAMLPFGYELLMCDTDMVWLKDPLPFFSRFPGADVLTSTDQVIPTVVDERLEVWQQVHGPYNIGIFHWRPTASAKKLAKEWKEMLLADDKIWDQNGFNQLVQKQLGPSVDEESGLVYAYDGNLKLGMLPASIFCSGHTYFVQAMYQQLRLEAYAVHTTFQFAGTEGKRHRLREAMVFNDEPEYYDSPGAKPAEDNSDSFSWDSNFGTLTDHPFWGTYAGGFLSFKASIPKSLLLEGEHNIESHFSLVNYQMKQIRTALAIASLLNRTLVMPPLWCRLDRLWFQHPGVLPGTMTRQPFLCPLDHVFEVNIMLKKQPEEEFGPGIDLREYSFLDNPLLPKQVKDSWLEVQLCQDGSENCQLSNETSRPGILRFPKHANEETFKTVFSLYKNIKVIQFSSMQDAFQGFTDKVREDKFRNRVKRYTSIWCCMENQTIGHIYYDMYWDEKPGWRPIPPQTPADDHPPW